MSEVASSTDDKVVELLDAYVSVPEKSVGKKLSILKNIYTVLVNQGKTLAAYETLSEEVLKYWDCDSIEYAKLLNLMIVLSCKTGNFTSALKYATRAYEIYQRKTRQNKFSYKLFNNITGLYFKLKEYDKALEYVERALALSREQNDEVQLATSLNNKAVILENQREDGRGIPFLEEAIKLKEKNKMFRELPNSYMNLADIYLYTGQKEKVMPLLQKARTLAQKNKDTYILADIHKYEARYFFKSGDYKKALKILDKSLKYHTDNGNKAELLEVLKEISKVYESSGEEAKALETYKEITRLNATIFKEEKARSLAQLESSFLAKQKLVQLEALTERNRELQEANRIITEKNVELKEVQLKLERANELLKKQAETDPLTGLLNQKRMYPIIEKEIERAKRYNDPLAMIMLDLDDFKKINDAYGHLKGDEVLKTTTAVVRNSIRSVDYAFRYGGEEFLLLLPSTTLESGVATAERLKGAIYALVKPSVTLSAGVSLWGGEDATGFILKTDKLLYLAKRNGKNRIESEAAS